MAMRYASLVMKSNSIAFAKKVNMKPEFLKIALAMMMANADPEEKEKLMKELSKIAGEALNDLAECLEWKENMTSEEEQVKKLILDSINVSKIMMMKDKSDIIGLPMKKAIRMTEFGRQNTEMLKSALEYGEEFGLFTKKNPEGK